MKVTTHLLPRAVSYSQYVLFDGFFTFNADMYNVFSNVSFDIKFDVTSVTRTNADGTVDFGAMRFGEFDGYGQDWIYYFAIPATNGLGQPNTNWTHISIPVNQNNTFAFWPNITTFSDILIGMDAGSGGSVPANGFNFGGIPLSQAAAEPLTGNTNMNGNQIFWIDNVQLTGPVGGIVHPVSMSAVKAIPAIESGDREKAVALLALPIGSWYRVYSERVSTNEDRLRLKRSIEELAGTNAVVASAIHKRTQ